MKTINNFIIEKLNKISSKNSTIYTYHPKNKEELRDILKERLQKDKNANLNDIDVSLITDMNYLFYDLDPHNIDISEWDISNVKNMTEMFSGCKNFNSDLSEWDVSNVKDMFYMFDCCYKFNCDLNNWDISNVKDKRGIFHNCESLQIPKWSDIYKR